MYFIIVYMITYNTLQKIYFGKSCNDFDFCKLTGLGDLDYFVLILIFGTRSNQ